MHQLFTREEAEEIREDFEDLKDTEFSYDGDMVLVDDIVITSAKSENNADEQNYNVVIVASGASEEVQYNISIREYIALKGVNYNFPS